MEPKNMQSKNTKFTSDEINEFFKYINDEKTKTLVNDFYGIVKKINGLKSFRDPEYTKTQINGTKVNGFASFNAGNVYEHIGRGVRTPEERLEDVKVRVDKMVKHVQQLLDKSPKFSNIEITVVNKKITLWRKADRFDDGDDKFGSSIYLKFSYKH